MCLFEREGLCCVVLFVFCPMDGIPLAGGSLSRSERERAPGSCARIARGSVFWSRGVRLFS